MRVVKGKAVFKGAPIRIDKHACEGNEKLKSVSIPDTVVQICSRAFTDCVNLETVELSPGVTSIGSQAFLRCSSLRSIVIPNGVESIGKHAFAGCSRLTFIVLPSTVAKVGDGAFMGCKHLVVAAIPNVDTVFGLQNSDLDRQEQHFDQVKVTQPPPGLFRDCPKLQYVIAPALLGDPGKHFEHTPLKALGFEGRLVADTPDSRRRVSELQFWSRSTHKLCTAEQQEWVKEVLLIGLRLGSPSNVWVAVISNIRTCDLPEHQRPIRNPFFARKKTSPFAAAATLKVQSAAEERCGDSATSERDFRAEAELVARKLKESALDKPMFTQTPDTEKPQHPPKAARSEKSNQSDRATAENVPTYVASHQESLPGSRFGSTLPPCHVVIPEDVTEIGFQAFANRRIVSVTIHHNVKTIQQRAFHFCAQLEKVDLANSITIGPQAFSSCTALRSVNLLDGGQHVREGGFGQHENQDSLKNSVEFKVGDYAFMECRQLTNISLGRFVTSIGRQAFRDCKSLRSVELPEATCIGNAAFQGCTALESVSFSPKLTDIGASAFFGCEKLTSLEIPPLVTQIRDTTFEKCKNLQSVDLPAVTRICPGAFMKCKALKTIELQPGLATIGSKAFEGCTSLPNLRIPLGVTKIGDCAFSGCASFTSVICPESVTSVGWGAFSRCDWLLVASLPNASLPHPSYGVQEGVFSNCRRLQFVVAPALLGCRTEQQLHLRSCPALKNDGVADDTPRTRDRASELTFWSTLTHSLCSVSRRQCARTVLLCAGRLNRQEGMYLPLEMWLSILGTLRVHELGPVGIMATAGSLAASRMVKAMGGQSLYTRASKPKSSLKFVGAKHIPKKKCATDSGLYTGRNAYWPRRDSTQTAATGGPTDSDGKDTATTADRQSKSAGGLFSKADKQSGVSAGDNTLWGRSKGAAKGTVVFGKKPVPHNAGSS